jgi:hypothetical protein
VENELKTGCDRTTRATASIQDITYDNNHGDNAKMLSALELVGTWPHTWCNGRMGRVVS